MPPLSFVGQLCDVPLFCVDNAVWMSPVLLIIIVSSWAELPTNIYWSLQIGMRQNKIQIEYVLIYVTWLKLLAC